MGGPGAPRNLGIGRRRRCRVAGWNSSTVVLPRPRRSPRPPRRRTRRPTSRGARSSRAGWRPASRPAWPPVACSPRRRSRRPRRRATRRSGRSGGRPAGAPQDEAGALQLDHAGEGAGGGQAHQDREDLRARPHVRGGHAALRLPGLRAPHPRHADRRPVRQEQARLPRRVRRHRDRPGRDAVRRARPHRLHRGQGRRHDRDALLQRLHRGGDGERLRPPEARHREDASRSSRAGSWSTSRASRGAC